MEWEERKEFLIKEIEIIQSIINRMASNSFLIKGWTITLVVGILLLKQVEIQNYLSFLPIIFFWMLDSYFLRKERLYRKLYEWIVNNRLRSDDYLFDMNTDRFKVGKVKTFLSKTLVFFYLLLLIMTLIYVIIIY